MTEGLAQDIPECPEETKSLRFYMKGKISYEDAIRDISLVIGNSQHLADENEVLPSSFPWIIPPLEELVPVAWTSIGTFLIIFPS
jgi:hypothetical protein